MTPIYTGQAIRLQANPLLVLNYKSSACACNVSSMSLLSNFHLTRGTILLLQLSYYSTVHGKERQAECNDETQSECHRSPSTQSTVLWRRLRSVFHSNATDCGVVVTTPDVSQRRRRRRAEKKELPVRTIYIVEYSKSKQNAL